MRNYSTGLGKKQVYLHRLSFPSLSLHFFVFVLKSSDRLQPSPGFHQNISVPPESRPPPTPLLRPFTLPRHLLGTAGGAATATTAEPACGQATSPHPIPGNGNLECAAGQCQYQWDTRSTLSVGSSKCSTRWSWSARKPSYSMVSLPD